VLASGGRAVSAAVRLRRRSGGRTKIVFVGRPWAKLDHFDLVVTTPQYRLPEAANVVRNLLPLNVIPAGDLAAARQRWARDLAHLPAPRLTVLLGGDSGSCRLDPASAVHIAQRANAWAHATGGSVLATSSPRTPGRALAAFEAALTAPGQVYRWRPEDAANPLLGYLALADRLLVTGESASMIAEACRTGRTVEIVPLPKRPLARLLTAPLGGRGAGLARHLAPIARRLTRLGVLVPPRDLDCLHRALRETADVAAAAGDPGATVVRLSADHDLDRAVARVEALLATHGATAYKAAHGVGGPAPVRPAPHEQNG
jgi:hypothetical protein